MTTDQVSEGTGPEGQEPQVGHVDSCPARPAVRP